MVATNFHPVLCVKFDKRRQCSLQTHGDIHRSVTAPKPKEAPGMLFQGVNLQVLDIWHDTCFLIDEFCEMWYIVSWMPKILPRSDGSGDDRYRATPMFQAGYW